MALHLKELPQPSKDTMAWIRDVRRKWQDNMLQLRGMIRSYVLREQDVVYQWIGGVAIFQKTIALTEAFCTTNGTTIAHGISDFGRLVDFQASFSDDGAWHKLPSNNVTATVDDTNITSVVEGSPSYTSFGDGYMTLWYTKA